MSIGYTAGALQNKVAFENDPLIASDVKELIRIVKENPLGRPCTSAPHVLGGRVVDCITKKRRLTGRKFGPTHLSASYVVSGSDVLLYHLALE